MKFGMTRTLAAAGVAMGLMIGSSNAAVLTYFGEDLSSSASTPLASTPLADAAETSFLGSLTGVGTENFDAIAAGTLAPLPLVFPGAGTATLTGSGVIVSVAAGSTNGNGRYGTSPTNYWEVDANGGFSVTFSAATAAFGFFGIDIGDFGEQLRLTLNDVAGTIIDIPHTVGSGGSTDGSVFFFGVIGTTAADTFTTAAFTTASGSGDVFAFDDMTVGALTQVCGAPGAPACPKAPEPTTLAVFGFGLAGLAFLRRRRTR